MNNTTATCGGLLRDHNGRYLMGFSVNLDLCTITMAELWCIYFGLKVAAQMVYSKVVIEADSFSAVKLCSEVFVDLHVCRPLVLAIQSLCHQIGEVQIVHQFREANPCANLLAKQGHELQPGVHLFYSLPSYISVLFHADYSGVTHPRVFAI